MPGTGKGARRLSVGTKAGNRRAWPEGGVRSLGEPAGRGSAIVSKWTEAVENDPAAATQYST
jgi:hypothetical protein